MITVDDVRTFVCGASLAGTAAITVVSINSDSWHDQRADAEWIRADPQLTASRAHGLMQACAREAVLLAVAC